MIAAQATAAAVLMGCADLGGLSGGDGGVADAEPSIYSNWEYVNGNDTAGQGLELDADGGYTRSTVVLLGGGPIDVQMEAGSAKVTTSDIDFVPLESSCPGAHPPYSLPYKLSHGFLSLYESSTLFTLKVDTSPAGSFNLTTGCFGADGGFTKSALVSVSASGSTDAGRPDGAP